MSHSLNKVMLIGNIGAEPEAITTATGVIFTKFTLATNRTYADAAGEQHEETEWHRLTFFGRLAEIVEEWVHKGDRLYVEGRIQSREREDEEGRARSHYDIIVNAGHARLQQRGADPMIGAVLGSVCLEMASQSASAPAFVAAGAQ